MSALPSPGERIGPYGVQRELARGGMGAVFVAADPAGRDVALKVMLPGALDGTDALRFRREAEACGKLDHPGIVRVHDLGHDAGRAYIAMDLIPGASLQDRLRRGPLPSAEAVDFADQLASALAAAHGAGVLHRDLKPDNVLLTPDGRTVLTDFGIAKQVDQHEHLTRTGEILGTPAFMAPEQANGEPVDERADVYALGATLYAMLTGRPPFTEPSALGLLNAVLAKAPTPPSAHAPGLPPDLEAICLKCLAKAPEGRYPSARALQDDLQTFRDGRPVRARPAGQLNRLTHTARRHPALTASATALLLALGVGAVALFAPNAPATQAPAPALPTETPPAEAAFDEAAFRAAAADLDSPAGRGAFLHRVAAHWGSAAIAAQSRELLNRVPGFPHDAADRLAPPLPRVDVGDARRAEATRLLAEARALGNGQDHLRLPLYERAFAADPRNAKVTRSLPRLRSLHADTDPTRVAGLVTWFDHLRVRPSEVTKVLAILRWRIKFWSYLSASLEELSASETPTSSERALLLTVDLLTQKEPPARLLERLDQLLADDPELAALLLLRARLKALQGWKATPDLDAVQALHAAQDNPEYRTVADQLHEIGLAWAKVPADPNEAFSLLQSVGSLGHREDPFIATVSTVHRSIRHWLLETVDFASLQRNAAFEETVERICTHPRGPR